MHAKFFSLSMKFGGLPKGVCGGGGDTVDSFKAERPTLKSMSQQGHSQIQMGPDMYRRGWWSASWISKRGLMNEHLHNQSEYRYYYLFCSNPCINCMHTWPWGELGGKASYTFPLRITCKKGERGADSMSNCVHT